MNAATRRPDVATVCQRDGHLHDWVAMGSRVTNAAVVRGRGPDGARESARDGPAIDRGRRDGRVPLPGFTKPAEPDCPFFARCDKSVPTWALSVDRLYFARNDRARSIAVARRSADTNRPPRAALTRIFASSTRAGTLGPDQPQPPERARSPDVTPRRRGRHDKRRREPQRPPVLAITAVTAGSRTRIDAG